MSTSAEYRAPSFRSSVARMAPDRYIVSLGGRARRAVADELERAFDTVAATDATWLVVDLSEATFIDSCLLGLLVREHKRLGGDPGRLVVVAEDARTLRPIEVSGLDRVLHVHPTLVDAILS